MPIVVVEQEKTLTALTTRLLKARTAKAVKEKAEQAIRAANPALDLDHLRPGMIVVVPRFPEGREDEDDDQYVGEFLNVFLSRLGREVDGLVEAAKSALEVAKAELETTAKVLDVDEVQDAAQNDSTLQGNLDSLRSFLEGDAEIAEENTAILLNGAEQWYTDLDDLSTVW
ncbi:hypothetical protein ACFZCG_28580 [Streptomyces tanashiensis]|uniref:hypothetical protein n=1 Tax=Streptomyces tanashiensis TaxID=67367 RepID=UPI0036E47440